MAGGAAYAVDKIHSRDIANNSVKSADLKNRKGVRGKDVRPNSLGGKQIDESALQVGRIARVTGRETGDCVLQVASKNCVSVPIAVNERSNLLVIATGNEESLQAPAQASCRVSIDGIEEPLAVAPGEAQTDNTGPTATNGFARTLISRDPVPVGQHTVALSCKRLTGQVRINEPTIAAIAIAAG